MAYGFNDDKSRAEVFTKEESINLNGGGIVKIFEVSKSGVAGQGVCSFDYNLTQNLGIPASKVDKVAVLSICEKYGSINGWTYGERFSLPDSGNIPSISTQVYNNELWAFINGYNPQNSAATITVKVTLLILN